MLLLWILALAITALWLAERRSYPVALQGRGDRSGRRSHPRSAAQTGAAVLALSLALDVTGAAAAAPAPSHGDFYLEAQAPAAWTSASGVFDGWMV